MLPVQLCTFHNTTLVTFQPELPKVFEEAFDLELPECTLLHSHSKIVTFETALPKCTWYATLALKGCDFQARAAKALQTIPIDTRL